MSQEEELYTNCVQAGEATGACDAENTCIPGYYCSSSVDSCRQYCRVSSPSCNEGSCNSFDPPVYIGSVEYGFCA